jgi:phosphoserine phosphatase
MSETTITLLGEKFSKRNLEQVEQVLRDYRYVSLGTETLNSEGTALQLAVKGGEDSFGNLRSQLLRVAEAGRFDVCVPPAPLSAEQFRLIVLDMDSTLIQAEVIDELAKLMNVGHLVSEITAAAMRGELEFEQSFRKRVALLRGLPKDRLQQVIESVKLMPGAETLISSLKALGYKTAVASGGFTFMADRLRQQLGIDQTYANELEFKDGAVTGSVSGGVVDGRRKAELLQKVAADYGIPLSQVIAVGDGANDLPMLRIAGMGVAFHAKPIVRAEAQYAINFAGLDAVLYYLGVGLRNASLHLGTDRNVCAT